MVQWSTERHCSITDRGIYCPKGDFFIDPWRPVDRALITHAHADHARKGHTCYLCTHETLPVLRHRLGNISAEAMCFGERRDISGISVSFHPAGHIPGAAQIRLDVGGEVWVVSGDYKLSNDGLSRPFEPVRCHSFVTECAFGLPVFKWPAQVDSFTGIEDWWRENRAGGTVSIIGAYSLGKAQRLITGIDHGIGKVFAHGAVEQINEILRQQGLTIPKVETLTPETTAQDVTGALLVVPPAAMDAAWIKRLGRASTAFASGWMALRGVRRRRSVDRGFVISDHADWTGLNTAVAATGAERIFVTHGYTSIFRRWLEEQGYDARIVATEFEGDDAETTDLADAAP